MLSQDLDKILTSVTEEDTIIDSVMAYIAGLRVKIADALAGAITPEIQAKIDSILTLNEAQKAKLASGIVENVPGAPPA